MNRFSVATMALVGLASALSAIAEGNTASAQSATARAFPLQFEMHVPFAPTAFPSGGRTYLMYELCLTNFGTSPHSLNRIEVLDADAKDDQPVATFEAGPLAAMLEPIGDQADSNTVHTKIAAGRTVVVFMSIALDRNTHVPNKLLHGRS
jgi:hypothetical protein